MHGHLELYQRLRKGQGLDRFDLPQVDGRRLITGLEVPRPQPSGEEFSAGGLLYGFLSNVQHIKRRRWSDLHFRECGLQDIAFFKCRLKNCVFEDCDARRMGFWWSEIRDCQFIDCDLRHVALGGNDVLRPRSPNEFYGVTFVRCDMRRTSFTCELFQGCRFEDCKFSDEDFMGARFVDCVFVGDLAEVTFRRSACPQIPENTLMGCDFRKASIAFCQFLNIDLPLGNFCVAPDMIVLPRGQEAFELWGKAISAEADEGMKWYIDYVGKNLGNPSIIHKSLLKDGFTAEQIATLEQICRAQTGSSD